MRHSQARTVLLATCAAWLLVSVVSTVAARRQPLVLGDGETADDAVRRGILAGDRIPRNIQAIRDRLQRELGGTLRTHIVANGGHEHPSRRNPMFMCFETYEGRSLAGP